LVKQKESSKSRGKARKGTHGNLSLEYITGIFDGEGSITLSKLQKRGILISISIANINMEIIAKIKNTIGFGYIDKPSNKNPCWRYRLSDFKSSIQFLKMIQPFTIIKREEINLALEFLYSRLSKDRILIPANNRSGVVPVKPPYSKRELKIVELLHQLKRR